MSEGAMFFWLFVIVMVYFIPSMAAGKKKRGTAVFVLNLFLGWTFIGWVVALVWALSPEQSSEPAPAPSVLDARRCPFCAEDIKPDAIVCKHCRRDLPAVEKAQPTLAPPYRPDSDPPAAIP